jgi:hypothetical protein
MEKLTLDDTFINDTLTKGTRDISILLGSVRAIEKSKNFEEFTKHQRHQIKALLHHLWSALNCSEEYFVIREDEELEDEQ